MKPLPKALAAAIGMLAVLMPGIPTFAEVVPSLKDVLADQQQRGHILDSARRSTVVVNNPCPSATFDLTDTVVVFRPPTIDATGALNGGAWKQVVQEAGCGAIRTLNVLAFVQGLRSFATTPLLPGTTRADPQLQKDGARYAAVAAGLPEKDCGTEYIADTEYLRRDETAPTDGKGAPWTEMWTLVACSGTKVVAMRFIPDSAGTAIAAGPVKAIAQNAR